MSKAAVSGPSLAPRSVAGMLRRFSSKRGSRFRHDGLQVDGEQLEPTKVTPRSPAQVDGILAWVLPMPSTQPALNSSIQTHLGQHL
jgi:hypothetical protein